MVEIKNLGFGYTDEKLFSELNLTLEPGNIYGLLGRNGAGKTSLLKLIAGLLFPDQGQCRTLGVTPRHRLPAMLADIFYLPEEFHLPAMVPLGYRRLYAPFYPQFSAQRFEGYLDEFGLPRDKKLTAFSYGQKKKFLLAFGLATEARLVLLDEPTNGLDIPSKSQFRRIVAAALTEERTFLISTHQVRDMEHLIDPVIVIEDGRIIFKQSLEEVARRLRITLQMNEPDPDTVLYAEKVLGGYSVVTEGTGGEDASIDLEVLFNLVTTARQRVESLFTENTKGVTK